MSTQTYRKWQIRLLRESRNNPIVAAGLFSMKQGAQEADAMEAIIRELCQYTTALARLAMSAAPDKFPTDAIDEHIVRSMKKEPK
jgi:hypothetical protein